MTRRTQGGCTQLCPARKQPTGRSHIGLSSKSVVSSHGGGEVFLFKSVLLNTSVMFFFFFIRVSHVFVVPLSHTEKCHSASFCFLLMGFKTTASFILVET